VERFDEYKEAALTTSALLARDGGVSLAQVQAWSGSYMEMRGSYEVGSSFDFFVLDEYGEASLFELFSNIGQTRDLDASLGEVLGLSRHQAEEGWLAYLSRVEIPAPPQVVELSPAHGALDVPCSIPELRARFDVPMDTNRMCVLTPGPAHGVTFENARWQDAETLVIEVSPQLTTGFEYRLSLGVEGRCALTSQVGIPLPLTPWHFECAE
jgi:hypothetical protein